MKEIDTNKKISFSAIDPYEEILIPSPEEKDSKKGFIMWGEANDYPNYLHSLYKEVSTLHSIIDGTVDFVCGNGVHSDSEVWNERINSTGETFDDLFRNLSRDFLIYGGYAINVIRNKYNQPVELYYIPFDRIRSDEKNNMLYYSKNWLKGYGVKYIAYPAFNKDSKEPSSIYYYNNDKTNTYPTPKWEASTKACEIEKAVNNYHLYGIKNGFAANYAISFNDGKPNENEADEIERNVIEKLGGEKNGGRILITFANDKEHAVELNKLETEDVGEKYKNLIERTKSEIFTSFRAIPNLFGLPTATGFSNEEYNEAFKLYNKTAVKPIQLQLIRSINKIIGCSVTVEPFAI